jgi:DEAD/DEAH box helicase domain-containing protein
MKELVNLELHVYNGLFGSHVALIMRRLRRLCTTFGNTDLQFVSCSATIANPEEVKFTHCSRERDDGLTE